MKTKATLLLTVFLLLSYITFSQTLSGTYYIGAAGTGPGGSTPEYASLKAACDALNDATITGNCTFYITSNITEPCTGGVGVGLAVNPGTYTITFKPYTGVQPVITFEYPSDGNSGPSGAFVIGIPGKGNIAWDSLRATRNIIIDGSNTTNGTTRDLTLQSSTTAHRNGMPMVIVGDVSNLTVKNTNIYYKVQTVSTSGNLFIGAIMVRSRNYLTLDWVPRNLIFENNHISGNFDGVAQNSQGYGTYQTGTPIPGDYPNNITLRNNKIEGKRRGIALYVAGSHNIYNNEIILNQNVAANTTNEAIFAANVDTNSIVNIYNNKISKISSITNISPNGNTAISIESFGTYNVYNNMIYGFELIATNPVAYLRGIKNSSATATLNCSFNSIYMTEIGDVGTGTVTYQGILVTDGTNTLKNNIVVTAESDFASYCIARTGVTGTFTSNYNNFFFTNATNGNVGFWGAAATKTLLDWQTASTQDANTKNVTAPFVSTTDLHIPAGTVTQIAAGGTPIVGITTDIDGQTRNATTPDIGADEFSSNVITIAAARIDTAGGGPNYIPDKLNDTVTVAGIVTSINFTQSANRLSFYIQDNTGGINITKGSTLVPVLNLGDSIKVTGKIGQFRGTTQIEPLGTPPNHQIEVLATNKPLPPAKVITIAQYLANPEFYEGQIIRINGLRYKSGTWPATGVNSTLYYYFGTDSLMIFIDLDTDIDGQPKPADPVDIQGIATQYTSSSGVYNDGYQISPRFYTDFILSTLSRDVNVNADWNLVSVPVLATNMAKTSLFPTATSPAYSYNNGYSTVDTLRNAKGYWLKFATQQAVNITGAAVTPKTIPVTQDWNIIGPFETNVPVSAITSTPPGIVTSVFYGYNNGYTNVDTLKFGKGYWVKVSQAGTLNLPSLLMKNEYASNVSKNKFDWGKIMITDANGKMSTLYLGKDYNSSIYDLPPLPPNGIFDARFSTNKFVEDLTISQIININSAVYPITIKIDGIDLKLEDNLDGSLVSTNLKSGNEIVISNPQVASIRVIASEIPLSYDLSQNYPNPFNPSTIINYQIPQNSKVTLTVFDILGKRIETLVDQEQTAGKYSIEFNAKRYASGIYYYELSAGDFRSIKKMMLIK